jgi:hypothetical protein
MPKIKYKIPGAKKTGLRRDSLIKIAKANEIIEDYATQGLSLTLRQLYYQFVSRGLIANNEREYKKLGDVIGNGRMVGLIDWDAIIDRTRYLRDLPHWNSPQTIVEACSQSFRLPKWNSQPEYLEVWIEKDALIGVIEGVCAQYDVPYLACRGYASASEVWNAGHRRIRPRLREGKEVTILYLGDHDPSGIDMTRDVEERLQIFTGYETGVNIERLALNMNQVEQYKPPPNPTKLSDPRGDWYVEKFGYECWELDALNPVTIRDLVEKSIKNHLDEAIWGDTLVREESAKNKLAYVAENWDKVSKKPVKRVKKTPIKKVVKKVAKKKTPRKKK